MGRAAGTGSPHSFVCPKLRRHLSEDRTSWMIDQHRVRRTGRVRPRVPSGALGQRNMLTAFEYRCGCGHVGWTTHTDIVRVGSVEVGFDQSWRPMGIRPYGLVELRDANGDTETKDVGTRRSVPLDPRWVEWRQRPVRGLD